MKYSADSLLRIMNSANIPPFDENSACQLETFSALDDFGGVWGIVVQYDVDGRVGYCEQLISPDGEVIDFWEWPESPDRERLTQWRGQVRHYTGRREPY